jgi:hypothetical protein
MWGSFPHCFTRFDMIVFVFAKNFPLQNYFLGKTVLRNIPNDLEYIYVVYGEIFYLIIFNVIIHIGRIWCKIIFNVF